MVENYYYWGFCLMFKTQTTFFHFLYFCSPTWIPADGNWDWSCWIGGTPNTVWNGRRWKYTKERHNRLASYLTFELQQLYTYSFIILRLHYALLAKATCQTEASGSSTSTEKLRIKSLVHALWKIQTKTLIPLISLIAIVLQELKHKMNTMK